MCALWPVYTTTRTFYGPLWKIPIQALSLSLSLSLSRSLALSLSLSLCLSLRIRVPFDVHQCDAGCRFCCMGEGQRERPCELGCTTVSKETY